MIIKQRNKRGVLLGAWFLPLLIGGMMLVGCGETPEEGKLNPVERIWAKIIPEEGTATSYGIPLSLENTQQFIDWYNTIKLSAKEQESRNAALNSLVAPCCDDKWMSTC